jgi:oxygen-independent coproporphyrinogen-3 oxidase
MVGMYLHVPFCKKACHYCDFHFSTVQRRAPVLAAMVRELEWIRAKGPQTLLSIYFGGGTPSILTSQELDLLLEALYRLFEIAPNAEITLEANPDDLEIEKLQYWRAAGINRLSVGIQSFIQSDLLAMNRAHDAAQASNAIPLIRAAGFENFSVDLIYGLPDSTMSDWQHNLQRVLDSDVPHLSAYALTVESGTALAHFVQKGKVRPLTDDLYEKQYQTLLEMTSAAGMIPYEISNFCLPGMEAVHNSSYWAGVPYWGVGPGAHSFDGIQRSWNVANNTRYAKAWLENLFLPKTFETLTLYDRYNEYLMTGLRTLRGIDPSFIANNFSTEIKYAFDRESKRMLADNRLETSETGSYRIPQAQRFFSDGIARDLFVLAPQEGD